MSENLDVAAMCLALIEFAQNSATASLIGARFSPKMNPIWRTPKRLPSVRLIFVRLITKSFHIAAAPDLSGPHSVAIPDLSCAQVPVVADLLGCQLAWFGFSFRCYSGFRGCSFLLLFLSN